MARILIVDDEPMVLQVVATTLRQGGFEVLIAESAARAVEQAKLHDGIRLLVVNHSVDGEPGRNLVEEMLTLQPDMKVLRISGHMEGELRAKGEMRPESFFLQKPFLPKQLLGKVRDIIGPEQPVAL